MILSTKQVLAELDGIINSLPNKAKAVNDNGIMELAQKHHDIKIQALKQARAVYKELNHYGGIGNLIDMANGNGKQNQLFPSEQ